MQPVIFHIDVNSAFLSWTAVEQLKNGAQTDIREIPAIIGGDQKSRHGVVLAKSVPAKKYGIRTGEPVANAFRKCPNLVMAAPNHTMYKEKRAMLWHAPLHSSVYMFIIVLFLFLHKGRGQCIQNTFTTASSLPLPRDKMIFLP